MSVLADVNLFDTAAFGDGRAEEWLTYLRKERPVWRHPESRGPGVWMLTKHADVVAVSRDFEVYSADLDRGGILGLSSTEIEATNAIYREGESGKMFIMMDPPEHGKHRKILVPAFSARAMKAYASEIQRVTTSTLDAAFADREIDFVERVAVAIPLNLVADVIGIPAEDRSRLFELVNRTELPSSPEAYGDPHYTQTREAAARALRDYGAELIAERALSPQDDLISRLAVAEIDGQPVPLANKVMNFHMLWGAGAETTRTAIAWGMYALAKHPEQFALLREDPGILARTGVEEILRWASPVHYFRRNLTQDVALRGTQLRAGESVAVWYSSANRDEEVFDRPFEFDLRRTPNPHVAFGGGGAHHCIGFSLARLELLTVFTEIASRVKRIELLTEPERFRNNFFRGLVNLPVRVHL